MLTTTVQYPASLRYLWMQPSASIYWARRFVSAGVAGAAGFNGTVFCGVALFTGTGGFLQTSRSTMEAGS
jgi:hypothetical protein